MMVSAGLASLSRGRSFSRKKSQVKRIFFLLAVRWEGRAGQKDHLVPDAKATPNPLGQVHPFLGGVVWSTWADRNLAAVEGQVAIYSLRTSDP